MNTIAQAVHTPSRFERLWSTLASLVHPAQRKAPVAPRPASAAAKPRERWFDTFEFDPKF